MVGSLELLCHEFESLIIEEFFYTLKRYANIRKTRLQIRRILFKCDSIGENEFSLSPCFISCPQLWSTLSMETDTWYFVKYTIIEFVIISQKWQFSVAVPLYLEVSLIKSLVSATPHKANYPQVSYYFNGFRVYLIKSSLKFKDQLLNTQAVSRKIVFSA